MVETQITVSYERKLSDGNYGSEGCSLTWTGPHDQDYGSIVAALRVQVLAFLSRSGAPEVAWKATHELQPHDDVPAAPMSELETEDVPF
jgi:hypothetical protein